MRHASEQYSLSERPWPELIVNHCLHSMQFRSDWLPSIAKTNSIHNASIRLCGRMQSRAMLVGSRFRRTPVRPRCGRGYGKRLPVAINQNKIRATMNVPTENANVQAAMLCERRASFRSGSLSRSRRFVRRHVFERGPERPKEGPSQALRCSTV